MIPPPAPPRGDGRLGGRAGAPLSGSGLSPGWVMHGACQRQTLPHGGTFCPARFAGSAMHGAYHGTVERNPLIRLMNWSRCTCCRAGPHGTADASLMA